MNTESVRCRACGYQLKSTDGCTFCLEVKRQLVWPVLSDEVSETSATAVINTTLRALKRRLTKIATEVRREGDEYDPRLTRDLATISRTLKELAAEKRKLEDREEGKFTQLGIEGRMDLMVSEFFAKLPEDFQVRLLSKMKETYHAQNSSLLPESTPEDHE